MKSFLSVLITIILVIGIVPFFVASADSANITVGALITFGQYPQKRIVDKAVLDRLNSCELNWISYNYYFNNKPEDFMWYADVSNVFEIGDRYRAVKFSHYRPSYSSGYDPDNFYRSEQDDNEYEPGNIYWFQFEPLVWRVLDVKSGLIITERIIDSQPFNNTLYGNNYELHFGYGDENHLYAASDWKNSTLRQWMNSDFYNTAFDGQEKTLIKTTKLTTPLCTDSRTESNAEVDTMDNLFLLSKEDVMNEAFGFKSYGGAGSYTNRIAFGSDYAKCQGLFVNDSYGHYYSGASCWRLRDPYYSTETYGVGCDGYVDYAYHYGHLSMGSITYYTPQTNYGIRPALSVNIIDMAKLKAKNENIQKNSIEQDISLTFGDVNNDGKVLADDARLALRTSAKLATLDEQERAAADVDGNGEVLADDARQILRYSAKLQHEFIKKP